jgi:NADH-quinone oxidoreductase subunit J
VTAVEALFLLLGLVTLGAAVLVVTTRQLVHAVLWLVVALAGVAGCFLLLSAEFLAWVQVLIYVGAVVVLLLFALMLTRAPTGAVDDLSGSSRLLALLVAAATAGVLVTTVLAGFGGEVVDLPAAASGDAEDLGGAIFSSWVLPFEALSLLLLAALVGAVVLSRSDIRGGIERGTRPAPAGRSRPAAAPPGSGR